MVILKPLLTGCVNKVRKRSEEHTSELQSHVNLVCRLLLEKKKKFIKTRWIDGGCWVFRDRPSRLRLGCNAGERVDISMNHRMALGLCFRPDHLTCQCVYVR